MGYRVLLSDSADRDMDSILTYIADTLSNPKAAADLADALEARFGELETHPLMFEVSRNEGLAQRGYRRFVVGSYVALYLVDGERETVTIARIFYGKRNYDKYI